MTRARDVATQGGLVLLTKATVGSSVTSITVNNCFSATYDSYNIKYVDGATNGAQDIYLTLNGITSGYKSILIYEGYGGGAPSAAGTTDTKWVWLGYATSPEVYVNIELSNPFLNKGKFASGVDITTGTAGYSAGYNASTTSSTGFTLTPGPGVTLTGGTVLVYGYKKN